MIATCKKGPNGLLILSVLPALLVGVPALAQYEPPKQMTLSPTGVDLASGRFTYQTTDLSIGPFTLERSYVGGREVTGSNYFGTNWTHNYAIYVVEKDRSKVDGIYVVLGRRVVHFTYGGGNYPCFNPDCDGATLVLAGSAFVYTDAQGNVYTFNSSVNAFPPPTNITPTLRNQRIARIDYADGHTLTYTYIVSRLRQVASNYGYSLVFEYGSNSYISKACGYNRAVTYVSAATTCSGAALAVSYGYAASSWPNVTSVTDVMGQTWGYTYLGDSNASKMTCVRRVNSPNCLIANNHSATGGQTLQQTTADGAVWDTYIVRPDPDDPQIPGEPPPTSEGRYNGPEGIQVVAVFGGGLLNSYYANGRTTYLQWDGYDLVGLTHPEGNSVGYTYRAGQMASEDWGAKPNSGVATVSRSSGFPEISTCTTSASRKTCNKPIWRKDYNNNQTDLTYDPAHGGVLTETGPAVAGVRPQVRYEYAARRAWVSSSSGGYVPEAVSIYLPVRKSFCATGAASGAGCAIAGDEVVTTYDYGPDSGPNNLALRSETVTAGGVSRKTCYGYDWQGNRISTTRPNGNCQ